MLVPHSVYIASARNTSHIAMRGVAAEITVIQRVNKNEFLEVTVIIIPPKNNR
jgi:hypothetical protein